jgi:hypothetical protein
MKRFILASGLLAALAIAAVAAPIAPKAAKQPAQASAVCGPLCGHGACPMKGSASAAAAGTVRGAAVATNGNACPVSIRRSVRRRVAPPRRVWRPGRRPSGPDRRRGTLSRF